MSSSSLVYSFKVPCLVPRIESFIPGLNISHRCLGSDSIEPMTPLTPYRFVPCRQIQKISRRCFNRPESPDTMIPGEVERHNRNLFVPDATFLGRAIALSAKSDAVHAERVYVRHKIRPDNPLWPW